MPSSKKTSQPKIIDSFSHNEASRRNIPSAEMQGVVDDKVKTPIQLAYDRRNSDLDPQFIWRDKDHESLEVSAPPLYIQEKVHPKHLIDDLQKQTREKRQDCGQEPMDLFADFNGLPDSAKTTGFYQHEGHWSNRMILGDALQVMASLTKREGLRGKVQCIYLDPPYGIKFNSNFQWSTTSRDVKDGKRDHISREPEQVKAFRDTWRDGIHSYLTYLRDRLIVARDLLTDSGSIFVQIGDENVHRVRALMDEVFGEENFVSEIACTKTSTSSEKLLAGVSDRLIWFAKSRLHIKYRPMFITKIAGQRGGTGYRRVLEDSGITRPATKEELDKPEILKGIGRLFASDNLTSQGASVNSEQLFRFRGAKRTPPAGSHWKTTVSGLERLSKAERLIVTSGSKTAYRRFIGDFPVFSMNNMWTDTLGQNQFGGDKIYVVQTALTIIKRCLLMTTDPGDLVLDPTCGSGTTAYVAEQWGRRWITIDTSRVALALARARIMGARYPYYFLADSPEGQRKHVEITRKAPSDAPTYGNIRQGFVYEQVPHITLKSITNNVEIDVIWDDHQTRLEPLRLELNKLIGQEWEEWEIPRDTEVNWSSEAKELHAEWWKGRIARQKEIDASIDAKADFECLYDKPYEDKNKVRVAGPFTVESVSPHRILNVDENDEIIDPRDRLTGERSAYGKQQDFATVILENLKSSGVQQAHKDDRLVFTSVKPFPGTKLVCGEGHYTEEQSENAPSRRAAIFIGPEFDTVSRPDLVEAAREASDLGFDVLIACAFNYDAHSNEFVKLGKVPVLKARMNADLHMADELKNTGKGNLFVIFGEPDIDISKIEDSRFVVKLNGVDIFKPSTGAVVSSGREEIACWFIDTDYNQESFFVRHAYFLGQNDPYKSLKTTLKAQVDEEAWASLHRDISRPFSKPSTGRIAVKVINHLGDEVMKVFSVS